MNKKLKFLTSSLCGVILASSLSLINVQAAPVQKNNVKTNIASLSTNSIISLSPAISKDGVVYWTPQRNATDYLFDMYNQTYPYYNMNVGGGDTGGDNYEKIYQFFQEKPSSHPANCTYKIVIKAVDSNRNVLNTATLYFYYDGSTFTQQ